MSGEVAQPEWHAGVGIVAQVTHERRLVSIGFGNGNFPVPPAGVKGGEHSRVAKAIDEVLHAVQGVFMRNLFGVSEAETDREVYGTVIFGASDTGLAHSAWHGLMTPAAISVGISFSNSSPDFAPGPYRSCRMGKVTGTKSMRSSVALKMPTLPDHMSL